MQIKFQTSTFEYQASNENNKQNVQVIVNKSKCKNANVKVNTKCKFKCKCVKNTKCKCMKFIKCKKRDSFVWFLVTLFGFRAPLPNRSCGAMGIARMGAEISCSGITPTDAPISYSSKSTTA